MRRRLIIAILLSLILIALFSSARPAAAASYARGVYAPYSVAGGVTGWANVNASCDGTFGCWTYVKIERLNSANLAVRHWDYQGGYWANEGWNQVFVRGSGCGYYRMVVDSYNDSPNGSILGVNLGVVEFNLGGNVSRYHQTYYSASSYACPIT